MTQLPGFASGPSDARRWLWLLLIAVTCGGCGAGVTVGSRTAPPGGTPTAPPATIRPSAGPPSAPASSSPSVDPLPATPPEAWLAGSWDAPVAGALGTFTWDGLASDAPWIVADPISDVSSGPVTVAFDPAIGQTTWFIQWAPVVDGVAGDAVFGDAGAAGVIVISPPATPGDWSLQVTATYSTGHDATWFWRLEVVR